MWVVLVCCGWRWQRWRHLKLVMLVMMLVESAVNSPNKIEVLKNVNGRVMLFKTVLTKKILRGGDCSADGPTVFNQVVLTPTGRTFQTRAILKSQSLMQT